MNTLVLSPEPISQTKSNIQSMITSDQYSPREARQLINQAIDWQINFYKLQHLSNCECNHAAMDDCDEKIQALKIQKNHLNALIDEARGQQRNLSIDLKLGIHIA